MNMSEYFDASQLRFSIKVITPAGKEVTIDPLAQVVINEDNVKQEIQDLPAQYAFFSSVYISAKKKCSMLDLKLSRTKNDLAKLTRKEASSKGKDLNNKQVEEIVSGIKMVQDLEDQLLNAESEKDQLYYICIALDKKSYSLKSLQYMQAKEEGAIFDSRKSEIFQKENN